MRTCSPRHGKLYNPFRSVPSRGQVDFCFLGLLVTSFGFSRLWTWRHPNISPDSSPDTRPSNSCSELAAIWASRLAALQPANTTASQQIRHTRAHVLISLECLHTTPILKNIYIYIYFFKYVKQRCEPSSKRRSPLPSADRPLLRLRGRSLSVDADMQQWICKLFQHFMTYRVLESTEKVRKIAHFWKRKG